MTKTTPYKAADYLRDDASIQGLVSYAAELEAENEELKKEVERLSSLIDRMAYGRD